MSKSEVKFLRHIMNAEGVRPDGSKVAAIEALELPKDCKELEAALGLNGLL